MAGVEEVLDVDGEGAVGADGSEGNAPGRLEVAEVSSPGVGLPNLCPPPENGVYFLFGCTYLSWCWISFTSTSWFLSTFMISRGARP